MKTRNASERVREFQRPLFALCAIFALLSPAAALPAIKQTFFVPFPETDFQTSLKAIDTTGTAVGNQIKTTISIVVPTAGTIIVYDNWEDGYEADPSNPVQASTQIWGDGNPAHGQPPGYPSNILPAGAVIKLQNVVGLPRGSTIAYDGRDRISATSAIAVTRAAWAVTPGTVLASASEVYDTRKYGTSFKIPVGTNTGTAQQFEYSSLHIIASQDNTTVQVDADGNGTVDATKNLNLGESMFINGGVKAGATVTSNYPVQVQELTGDIGSTYESRTFAIRPTVQWGASYYAPVGTTLSSEVHNIFAYNPNAAPITVTYETSSGTGTFSVPANGNYQFAMPMNSGAHFYTAGNEPFYAVGANDSGAAATANQTHDWGYALLPENYLTTGIVVPWGPGSDSTVAPPKPDNNGSPVWVTPTQSTTVYVNYSGDTSTGTNTAPNGWKYDVSYAVAKWASQRIYDPNDNDMTRARVFTADGTRMAAAWGEDPSKAGPGSPYLDLGTTIVPFPQPVIIKTSRLAVDANSDGKVSPGDTIEYTVRVSNEGVIDLDNTIVLDSLPSSVTYLAGSTTVNGTAVADNATPSTAFPVDESGYVISSIPPGSFSEVKYRVTVNAGATTIINQATASAGGVGGSTLTASTVVVASSSAPTITFSDSAFASVTTYAPNAGVYVSLNDAGANNNPSVAETVSVTVRNLITGDLETLILTETGPNTGVFRSTGPLPSSVNSGSTLQDGTMYAQAGNGLRVDYTNPLTLGTCNAPATILSVTQYKKLYLSDPGQALDRVDPVATADATTASTPVPLGGSGTITLASTSSGSLASGTSLTFSHTPGTGANRLLLVTVSLGSTTNAGNAGTCSGVTFNGTAMTLVGNSPTGVGANTYIYQLLNPGSSAANVVVTTTTSSITACATTFNNVNQTTPLGTFVQNGTSTAGTSASVTVASAAGELVYSTAAWDEGLANESIVTDASQTELWNLSGFNYVSPAVSTKAGAASVVINYTAGDSQEHTIAAVPIKPAAASSPVTFTQAPAMAKSFIMPSGGTIGLTAYVSSVTGTMPAGPAVTATLKKGTSYAAATTFATLASPVYNSGAGTLVWSGVLAADTTVAVGEFVYLDIANNQSGVGFSVDYDSITKPSAISLPTSTVITVDSFGIYDAPYPGGSLIGSVNNGQKAYFRVTASDPFGAYDVTSLDVTVTTPSGGTSSVNLTTPLTGTTTASGKTFEYPWTAGPSLGGYSITVKANEGTEGINATSTMPIQVTQLDLGTPSTTTFTDSSGNTVTSYTTSGPAYVQVNDGDKNTDPLTVQTVTVVVTTSTGDRETVTLTETGVNTGIFRSGPITVNTNAVTQGNNALNIVAGTSLLASYVDLVDATDTSSANAVIATAATSSVSIYKSLVSPASGKALVNDAVSYNIQIANTGSTSLPTVSVSDSFDSARLQYAGASVAPSATGTGTLSWTNVGPLAVGQILNIQVNFTAIATGVATNSATAGGTATSGPSVANVTIDRPRIAISKTLLTPASGPAYKGDNVTFRIVVQNTGTTQVTTLPVSDNFSGRTFEYVSATVPPDSVGSGALLWNNIGPLAAGASRTIDVTMLVNGAAAPADNTADVSFAVDANGNQLTPVSSTASLTTLAGTIGSTVFQDGNNNGLPDSGEGIANVTVFADLNNNGIRDAGEPFAVTNAAGTYQLYNLAPGTYSVVVDTATLPVYLNKPVADPDAVKDSKTSVTLTKAALANTTSNFGYQYPGLGGNVYDDANGLADNTVNGTGTNAGGALYAVLVNAAGKVVQSVAVTTGGTYLFPNVTPNSYTIVLGTTAGTVGAAAPSAALPAGWVNTGEFVGSGAGNDGTANGILAVTVGAVDVSNADFGIDQRPVPNAVSSSPANPGGTTQVTVPALSGSDPEGSPVTTMIIKSLPANGTLYYNGVAVSAGQTIPNYTPSLLTLDPVGNGATTVVFNYSVADAAGVESSTTAPVTLTFTPTAGKISIAGNVYDDANGLLGTPVNTVDGTGTNAGGLLYANLVNASNNVAEVVAVASDGSYSFGSVASSGTTGNFTVVLSTTAGTVGGAAPAAALPAAWANTGEFLGSGTGSDGTVNGILAVAVSNANVNNANFGIDRKPTANALNVPAQPNPNLVSGTAKVTVPSLSGSDPEDASVTTIIIKSLPGGTSKLFYNGVAVTAGQTISSYNPSLLTVQPGTGAITVTFTFSAVDAAGKESASAATVTMPFTGISISGNVYDDANGLSDSMVNGTGTNAGGTLYVNLVNGSNNVVQVATVAADGSYIFPNPVTGSASYTVVLSTTVGTVGSAAPAVALPAGWVDTGEFLGTGAGNDGAVNGILPVAVGTVSVSNANFGIDRKPTANAVTAAAQLNPGSTAKVLVPALGGSDPEDVTTATVAIKTLPASGILYYNGVAVTAGQVITSYNSALLAVDPADGNVTVSFTYAVQDSAGVESAAAATVSMPFTDINIAGNVYDDANGLVDGAVNGTATNAGGTLFVNLVNAGNKVVQSVMVAADGSYVFGKVAPNTSYSVMLGTSQGLVGGFAPPAVPPSGYVNTGEYLGAGAGSDGTPDGILAVAVGTTSVTNANFGIEQAPSAVAVTAASQINPGGTTKVTVPTLSGSDPEDASVTTLVIKTLPANGTLYYNGVAVTTGQTITSYAPSLLKADPNDGSITVAFTYAVVDMAGRESLPAAVSMPFSAINLSGYVYDDANGLTDGTVNGTGTNAGGTLFASLVSGGNVVRSVAVAADGTYQFGTVPPNVGYSVVLGTVPGIPGNAAPAASLPSGYANTGEFVGTGAGSDGTPDGTLAVAVGTTSVTNVNFGIKLLVTVSGQVRNDINGDGNPSSPDFPISGVTVQLFADADGDGVPDGAALQTQTTDVGGHYAFTSVGYGKYLIVETDRAGSTSTWDASGSPTDNRIAVNVTTGDITGRDFLDKIDCARTWAEWQYKFPGLPDNGPGGNPDGDLYNNLLEYAFCFHPDSGIRERCPLGITTDAVTGKINVTFSHPQDIAATYTLEAVGDLSASPGGWFDVTTITPVVTPLGNGGVTVAYNDLESIPALAQGSGFLRLRVDVDTDGNGSKDATARTMVIGWSEHTLETACGETYSSPFLPCEVFSGTVTSGGTSLDVGLSVGTGNFAMALQNGKTYYVEVLSGVYEGSRFEVDPATSTATSIGIAAGSSHNTRAPVDLSGARVAVRAMPTFGDLLPAASFQAGTNPADSDNILVFEGGNWVTYYCVNLGGGNIWVKAGETPSDCGGHPVDPSQGLFINRRGAATTVLQTGWVRDTKFAAQLAAGYNFIGSGYPVAQSPGGRLMSQSNGFTGTRNINTADQILIWQGDATPGASGFKTTYLLDGGAAYRRWVSAGDSFVASKDGVKLFGATDAAFLLVRNAVPGWTIPPQWTP